MKILKKSVSVLLSLMIVFSLFTIVPITASAEAETYVDTISGYTLAKSLTGYYDWNNVNAKDYSEINSPAVYNGRTAYEWKNDTSTFRIKDSDSGIYTIKSGGNVKKVTAKWVDNNADRTLLIYGKDSPYNSYTELFDEDERGDLIGNLSFVKGGDTDTLSCTFDGNYQYIGFSAKEGPLYLESIEIEWTTGCAEHDWDTQWNWSPEDGEDPGISSVSASMTATCKACGEEQTVNGVVERTDSDAATCVSEGNVSYTATATLEGKTYSSTNSYTVPMVSHNISYVEKTAPRYENGEYINGTQAHYECSVCHKIFADENGETELDSVPVIPYFTFEMDDSHIILTGYNGHDSWVTIPNKVPESYLEYDPDAQEMIDAAYGVEEIAANVFKDHTELENVEFSKFIQTVGKSTFEGCSSLKNVAFKDGVGLIKANAFDGCSSMENFTVGWILRDGIDSPNFANTPDDLTFIGAHVAGGQKSKLKIAAENFGKLFEITDNHIYGDSYYVLDGETVAQVKSCVACDDTTTVASYQVEKHDAVAETCLTNGSIEYYETTSGDKLYFTAKEEAEHDNELMTVSEDDLVIPAHTLTHVDYKAETRMTDGNIEYWHCEKCDKYFKEENGEKVEITKAQTVIPMTLRKLEAWQVYAVGEHFAYPTVEGTLDKNNSIHGYSSDSPYLELYFTTGNNHINMPNWNELAVIYGTPDKVFADLVYVHYLNDFALGAVYYNANVAPQVKWSDDGKTATFTMKNFYWTVRNIDTYRDLNYTLTKTVDVEDTVIPATCDENGKIEHKAVLRQGNYTYEAVRYEDIENDPPTGEHTYGEPSWEWADDHSSATATFTCSDCGDTVNVTDEDIKITENVPTEPGVSERTFSAEVEFEDNTYSTSKTENIRYRSVTWKNYDGEVLQFEPVVEDGKPHEYTGETPVKPSDDVYSYTFKTWTQSFDENENYVYTAEFTRIKSSVTVIWQNYDGTELEKDEKVPAGTMPEYNGATPVRESTVEKVFTFTGWSPELSEVTDDVTYTAQFSESPREYTVIWKDEDGTVLETDENVPYGTIPTYNGNTPTKESSDEADFTFSGWTPEITTVTGDAVYTAAYTTDSLPAWNRLQRSINNATNGSVIQLTEDCVATNNDVALVIPTDKVITIDLNGHAINRNLNSSKAGGNVITNNGTLTITDTSEEQTGAVKGGYNNNNTAGILNTQGSTFTLAGGAVTGNRTNGTGGGAGIANAGTMYMTGGTVSDNKVYGTGKNGGGIYNLGTLSISGGTITGNYTQTGNGGGIYFQTTRTLNISGSPVIIGNTCGNSSFKSNDLYLERNAAQAITVTGPLDSSAKIGIREKTKATGEAFTKNLAGNGTADNFISDYDDVAIRINSAGEAYTAKLYSISTLNNENGTISADKTTATAGETVTLTAEPNNGYKLAGISVKDASNHDVTVNGNQFTMPGSNVTVSASFEPKDVHLAGHSISLAGDIAVNFYMELSDEVINSQNNPYMLFTIPDTSAEYQTQKVYVKDITPVKVDGKNYYIFKCRVAAKDMNAKITAKLIDGTERGEVYTYSVKQYADYLLAHTDVEEYANAAPLVRAMLTYGENAEYYFDKTETEPTALNVAIPEFTRTVYDLPEGVTFGGATLSLKSETTLSIYFNSETKPTLTCTDQGITYETEKTDTNEYVIRIRGIAAYDLDKQFTVYVNGTKAVEYSPLRYCFMAQNSDDTKLANTVKALYLYWFEAEKYFV